MSIKKVAVVGGNGKVGKLILTKLKQSREFEPLSIIRNENQVEFFKEKGINTKVISLEDSVHNLIPIFKDQDAIIFSAGAGGKGLDKTFAIDLDGAVKMMEIAKLNNIKRFIMVSAIKADDREFWYDTSLRSYYIAKKYADLELKRSGLDYTILRPGQLVGEEIGDGLGKVTLQISENRKITRDDVATIAIESLRHDNTIGKIVEFVNGETPIDEFISNF